jgi:predicted transcriptional regulator YdeE
MEYMTVELPEFLFLGISARAGGPDAELTIGKLWERFTAEKVMERIPEFTEGIITSLYTDYADKSDSEYTVYVGARVRDLKAVPEGLELVTVPAQKYAQFLVRGPVPQSVSDGWEKIKTMELPRAYGVDYDVYGPKSQNEEIAEVEIYVSIQ